MNYNHIYLVFPRRISYERYKIPLTRNRARGFIVSHRHLDFPPKKKKTVPPTSSQLSTFLPQAELEKPKCDHLIIHEYFDKVEKQNYYLDKLEQLSDVQIYRFTSWIGSFIVTIKNFLIQTPLLAKDLLLENKYDSKF
uniref:Uncharacterized protein n=1 Tax=Octopus bimaculoides TaxID=37653 RepID=A0A0L8GYC6_OCTBM